MPNCRLYHGTQTQAPEKLHSISMFYYRNPTTLQPVLNVPVPDASNLAEKEEKTKSTAEAARQHDEKINARKRVGRDCG